MKASFFFCTSLTVSALLLFCADDPVTPPAFPDSITATIFEPGGNKTATGVSLRLFAAGSAVSKPVAAYVTDDKGVFSIDKIPAGRYALWAQKDSFVLFQDSVIISPEYTTLRNDTLESPSSLTGVVQVQCGHDPRTVTIQVQGTGRSDTVISATGTFTLSGLAGGAYECVLTSSLEGYLPFTKVVSVGAGRDDTLTDTLRLFYTGIPFIEEVCIAQDTLMGIVRLSWKKTGYKNVQDYAVYRASCADVNNTAPPACFTLDTFFVDTAGIPVTGKNLDDMQPSDTASRCLRYRIAVRNRNQEIGPALGYDLDFASGGRITTYFDHEVQVIHHWCGNRPCRIASIHDTVEIAVAATNFARPLCTLLVYDPVRQDTIAAIVADDSLEKTLESTVRCTFDSVGTFLILAIVIDNSGSASVDTIPVSVIEDKPVVRGCNDTGVFCENSVSLYGSATDRYGSITRWEWKIGTEEWTETSSPEKTFTAPDTEQELLCQLAATDDDGYRTIDTIRVFTSNKVQRIAAEGHQILFMKTDGNLWACGQNEYGQFGEKIQMGDIYSPVKISGEVQRIAEGSGFSLILKSNGDLWGCGKNDYGQLGNGPTARQYPFLLPLMSDVRDIAAGGFHSLILDTGSILWACGNNSAGQLGDGMTQVRYVPVQMMTGVKNMAAGEEHSLILTSDGLLRACGKNNYGQLGDSSMLDQATPVRIMTGVNSIAAGSYHSLIIKTDGSLWTCGQNNYGQLGADITESWSLPVCVATGVRSIAAGQYHSLILKTDGSLWACGSNSSGQIGNNTKINCPLPVQIMTDVTAIAAGALHSLVLKTDGTVWGCGNNVHGQLGNDRAKYHLKPVRIIPFQDNTRN